MIFQVLFTFVMACVFAATILRGGRTGIVKHAMLLVCATGTLFVWWPSLTTELANFLGIGRGADLLLYCFVMVTLLASFWLLARLKQTQERLTMIVRHLAVSSPDWPDQRLPGTTGQDSKGSVAPKG